MPKKKQKPKYKVTDASFTLEACYGTGKDTMTWNMSPKQLWGFETKTGIYPTKEYLSLKTKVERLEANTGNLRLEMEKSYGYRIKKWLGLI